MAGHRIERAETLRTSRSAAGCNKPVTPGSFAKAEGTAVPAMGRTAEETGEVVRNHEVGTRCSGRSLEPEVAVATSSREWTPGSESMEGQGSGGNVTSRQRCRRRGTSRDESHERRSVEPIGASGERALEWSEAEEGVVSSLRKALEDQPGDR